MFLYFYSKITIKMWNNILHKSMGVKLDNNANDKSGINCLAGFAFQIKVFAYYSLLLQKQGDSVEFETIDDVNVKITNNNLDSNADCFRNNVKHGESNRTIQVKRTNLTPSIFAKTLFNWILLRDTGINVSEYILFSDSDYTNEDKMFNTTFEKLFKKAVNTKDTRSDSIEVQIKHRFDNKLEEFNEACQDIKNNYNFIGDKNINDLIYEAAKRDLRHSDVNPTLYDIRLNFYLKIILIKVLSAINKKEPFILTYQDYINILEELNSSVDKDKYYLPYCLYKEALNNIKLEDSELMEMRETNQLYACGLKPPSILERLKQMKYYTHFRILSLENANEIKTINIETTTYNNFNSVIEELIMDDKDIPLRRLIETEKRTNSYADNEQLKNGSCIYLTGNNIPNQISWKD